MIEKMQMVYVVSSSLQKRRDARKDFSNLGLLHLAEKKSPARAATERFTNSFLSKKKDLRFSIAALMKLPKKK